MSVSEPKRERLSREVERAASELVDAWMLVEVGGFVTQEDRRSRERRLARAVRALAVADIKQ